MLRSTLIAASLALMPFTAPANPGSPFKEVSMTEAPSRLSPVSQAYAAVLSRHMSPGPDGVALFDYAAVKDGGDHAHVKAFIAEQAARTPSAMSAPEATAYWANLYNAVTLDVVLDDYPVKSIRSLGPFTTGPWKRDVVTVEGESLSLDNIEHDILRVDYATPYIHYMVNCASIGCPNLRGELWTAEGLEGDQRAAAAAFVNADRGVRIRDDGRIAVSKIYRWFSEDFGDTEAGLRAHLAEHATGERLQALTSGASFKGSHYDWTLNRPK
ncbi:DUF547 domain-containing protein [uncultured Algimonas sp.]|uniref:DUF547 domain-containing protein n=1 Tax=uncultured Algimonas sp. TaxID=1547920 RepID=UPI0026235243|nr:DUF547 domain-containing protein [uncultured Algimonas sp.]